MKLDLSPASTSPMTGLLAFELSRPHFGFLPIMGFPDPSADIFWGRWQRVRRWTPPTFALSAPIGTGPFRLASHDPDGDTELVANRTYWGGSPQVGRIILRRMDDEAALIAFEAGEIDVMLIDALDADRVLARPGVRVEAFRSCEYRAIMTNRQNPALADRRVREAIMVAIDREAVVRDVLKGMGEMVSSPLSMPEWAVNHSLDDQYPYDPDRARALLADAGYGSGLHFKLVTGPGAIPARHDAPFLGEGQALSLRCRHRPRDCDQAGAQVRSRLRERELRPVHQLRSIGSGLPTSPPSISTRLPCLPTDPTGRVTRIQRWMSFFSKAERPPTSRNGPRSITAMQKS